MKRLVAVFAMVFALGVVTLAQQSLGDAARDIKKNKDSGKSKDESKDQSKKPTIVYTNDNLPAGTVNMVSTSAAEKKEGTGGDKAAEDKEKKKESYEDERAGLQQQWKQRIADAKKEVARLEVEFDELYRQNRTRAAQYVANWSLSEDDKLALIWADRADALKKKKALEAAQEELEELRTKGRAAGMPRSILE